MHDRSTGTGEALAAGDAAAIRRDQIRLLYAQVPGVYLATLGTCFIAALFLSPVVPAHALFAWVICAVALTAVRFWMLRVYRRSAPQGAALDRWGAYITLGSIAAAALWGSAAFVLFVPGKMYYGAFLVILISGMIAGASISLSTFLPTYHAFVLPVGAALLARLLTVAAGDSEHAAPMLALAALVALFITIVYSFARRAETNLVNLLKAEQNNRRLGVTLAAKVGELARTSETLAAENRARTDTERVLRENEQQQRLFELAIGTTSSGIIFTDPMQRDNPIVYVNPAFERITGYRAGEAIGRNVRFLLGGDEHAADVARLREALRDESPATLVLRNYRRDGTAFWNELSLCPLRDERGHVVRFVVIHNDVTRRIETEVELRRTRDERQAILDNAPALIYTRDLDGRFLMVNGQWEKTYGMPAARAAGKRVHDILPSTYADAITATDRRVIESGKPAQIEHTVPGERGLEVHLTTAFPLRDASGRIYAVCGISADITERKREQTLQAMQHQVSRVIADTPTTHDAMRRVLRVVCEYAAWDWGAMYLAGEGGTLSPCETWTDSRAHGAQLDAATLPAGTPGEGGMIARALSTRDPVWVQDLSRQRDGRAGAAVAAGLRTGVAIPVMLAGVVMGLLEVYSRDARALDRRFLRIARSIGQQLGQCAKRRDAEAQTRRAEERLELALVGSELALWDWSITSGEIYLGPRWAEMLGRPATPTRTDIAALTEVAHPDDRAAIRLAILHALKQRSNTYAVVHRVRKESGEWIWIESTGKVVERDARGRASRMAGTIADITARRVAAEDLRQTRALLESIVENLPSMIFVKDTVDLRYVRLNKAGEALLGLTREELVGKSDYDFFPQEQADFSSEKDRETIASGTVVDIPDERVHTRDRGVRHLRTRKLVIADPSGAPRYLLGIAEDITELKEASEAIQGMNEMLVKKAMDLAASNEELDAFAYSVSHDLRAPLRHINGFVSLLRDNLGERLDATSERYVAKIQDASGRMAALIDELLALSRTSRKELRYTTVALERLVREIVDELRPQAQERTVEWVVRSLPPVKGDRVLLRQAFYNLLDNAHKYTRLRADARIEVGLLPDGGKEMVLYVRDNGIGFDLKYEHKLFGVFQRLHRQEEFPGSGIGLAHVRRIVERHGGRVWAESARGEGATFYVALPKDGA